MTWMNDSERQYPVTIDPIMEMERDYLSIHDATVAYGNPSESAKQEMTSGWSSSLLFVGNYTNYLANMESAAIVHTDISELKEARILDAKLTLFYYTNNTSGMQVNAYQVTGTWNKNSNLLYGSQTPSSKGNALDYSITPSTASQGQYTSYDITQAVQEWVMRETTGILLRAAIGKSGW